MSNDNPYVPMPARVIDVSLEAGGIRPVKKIQVAFINEEDKINEYKPNSFIFQALFFWPDICKTYASFFSSSSNFSTDCGVFLISNILQTSIAANHICSFSSVIVLTGKFL